MLRYSFVLMLATGVLCLPATAQTAAPRGGEARVFSFGFDSDAGYLGVQTVEVNNENYGKYGLSGVRGVAIEKVSEGSPAERAGLQAGDVIVRVNGDEITSSRKLTRLIGEISPDHTARITVARGGSEREISVTLGRRPTPAFANSGMFERFGDLRSIPMPPDAPAIEGLPRVPMAPGAPNAPMVWAFGNRRQIGVGVHGLSKQLADHYGVEGGVLIDSVREDSPAAKAGLKAGDIIVQADGKDVKNEGDVLRAIAEKKEGSISITVVRDRNRQTFSVTPEEIKGDHTFEFGAPADGQGAPGVFRMTVPRTPAAPRAPASPGAPPAPATMDLFRIPGRII
jgi:serine protease Do